MGTLSTLHTLCLEKVPAKYWGLVSTTLLAPKNLDQEPRELSSSAGSSMDRSPVRLNLHRPNS